MKKAVFPALAAVLVAAVFALALVSCVSSWSDGGYLVISFGGGRNLSWPPSDEEVARMEIEVTLDGPGGVRNIQVEGKASVTVPVSPGRWRIDSRAFVDKKLRAVGDTEYLQVKGGRNNVNVILRRPPALSLSVSGTHVFPGASQGYAAAPAALAVTVTNGGSLPTGDITLALSGADPGSFALSAGSLPGIALRDGTASFAVAPRGGLALGTHAATVTVSGEGTSASFGVSFEVNNKVNAAAPNITVDPVGPGGTVAKNTPVTLSVTAASTDGGTLSYQWYSNAVNAIPGSSSIPGATLASYTPSTGTAGTFFYHVQVTNTIADNLDGGNKSQTVNSALAAVAVGHTVTFDAQGGSPVPASQLVINGGNAAAPAATAKSGSVFGRWYKEGICTTLWDFDSDTVTGDITLYAGWLTVNDAEDFGAGAALPLTFAVTDAGSWAQTVSDINAAGPGSAGDTKNWIISLVGNFSLPGTISKTFTPAHITVSIRGSNAISLSSDGCLLFIAIDQTVILRDATLHGFAGNDQPLVRVNGALVMEGVSQITGNHNYSSVSYGGGVEVSGGESAFTMNGGAVSGNSAIKRGGGVAVFGAFTMNGGTVSSNSTGEDGGGVSVVNPGSTFTMNGGSIFGNNADNGGGVSVDTNGTFRISGGTVYGNGAGANSNTAAGSGAALYKTSGTAQHGPADGSAWQNFNDAIDIDIQVIGGVLQ